MSVPLRKREPEQVPIQPKPPLGCRAEWLWRELRIEELREALDRYLAAGIRRQCMVDWEDEIRRHTVWLAIYHPSRVSKVEVLL